MWAWFLSFWRPPFYLRSIILNLKSGDALSGVHWQTRGPWLVLRQASGMKAGQPPLPIDGEVVVHREHIAFIQVLQ